jgi:hypothetical protein
MPSKQRKFTPPSGFDVTQVIGRVEFDQNGTMTPYESAFQVVAGFGDAGTFTFPGHDGTIVRVTVEYGNEPTALPDDSTMSTEPWDSLPGSSD